MAGSPKKPRLPRIPRATSDTGARMFGIPGLTRSTENGADGWYVAGTFNGGDENGWTPLLVKQGGKHDDLQAAVRRASQTSIAYVLDGDIIGYRTVHGPVTSLKTLKLLIEREVETGSPLVGVN